MEDPDVFLLQLLHVICDRFPSVGVRESDDKPVLFQVGCPCKTSHPVSHLGFILLEEVQEALGTAEQWRRSALANCESHGSQHSAPGRLVSTKGGSGGNRWMPTGLSAATPGISRTPSLCRTSAKRWFWRLWILRKILGQHSLSIPLASRSSLCSCRQGRYGWNK